MSTEGRVPDETAPGDDEQRRAYASPVCYAHEFESALDARAATAPRDVHRLMVEQATEAVVFADRAGTIRLWNRGAERLFGCSAAEVTRSQHKDGRKLYVELSFGLASDDTGAVIGAFAIARDCSDRVGTRSRA
jgi:PAS domain-containing protein